MTNKRRPGSLLRRAWPFVAVGAVSIVVAGFIISSQIQRQYLRLSHDRLAREAAVVGHAAESLFQIEDPQLWHSQALKWQRILDARVTIIDSAGLIVTDSDWSADSAAALCRTITADSPEETDDEGHWSVGYSTVRKADLLYAAAPVVLDGRRLGTVRLALPLSALTAQQTEVRKIFLTILVITGLLLLAISLWVGNSIRRPLAKLAQTTARYSQGDWEARVPIDPYRSSDEFSELAHDFNRMADEVESRFFESRREKNQLEAVLANMSDGVLAVDAEGHIRLVNDAFVRLFRPVLSNPIGQPHAEAFRDRGLNELIDALLAGATSESEELEVASPHRRILVVRPALIEAASGEDVRGVLVARDVTARRQIDRMRRDFVANVSHELRTPLTSILGYVSALRDARQLEPPASVFLDTIERNADRMNRIVSDLLELSRIEAPGYAPTRSEFSLSGLIEEIRMSLAQVLARRRQTLQVRVEDGAEACVADRDAVGRILVNLIDNALKYSPEDSVIDVRARRQDESLVIEVADRGIGVPEADRPRLFERFYRVDRGRSRELGGTGLGLSIVKHLAEAHGGSALYEPNFPSGSRVSVRIPQSTDI